MLRKTEKKINSIMKELVDENYEVRKSGYSRLEELTNDATATVDYHLLRKLFLFANENFYKPEEPNDFPPQHILDFVFVYRNDMIMDAIKENYRHFCPYVLDRTLHYLPEYDDDGARILMYDIIEE